MECGIERPFLYLEGILRSVFNDLSDRMSMCWPHHERPQDEHVQSALQDIASFRRSFQSHAHSLPSKDYASIVLHSNDYGKDRIGQIFLSGFGLSSVQRSDTSCGAKIAKEVIQWRLGKEIVKGQEIAAGGRPKTFRQGAPGGHPQIPA